MTEPKVPDDMPGGGLEPGNARPEVTHEDIDLIVEKGALAFAHGLRDFAQGKPVTDNPFPQNSIDHKAWAVGWHFLADKLRAKGDQTHDSA